MLVAMDGHRLTLDQAGADAIGALPRLTPVSPQPQTGALENPSIPWLGHAVQDDPAGIGQQHRAAAGKLAMQAVHLVAGDGQDLLQLLATLQHTRMFKHGGRHRLRGVEVIILQAPQP